MEHWMDIESLLNPEGECNVMTESMDREIYQAAIEARAACENLKINGGDGFEGDGAIKPRTPGMMSSRVSTINKCISDVKDPTTCKTETLSSLFNSVSILRATGSFTFSAKIYGLCYANPCKPTWWTARAMGYKGYGLRGVRL